MKVNFDRLTTWDAEPHLNDEINQGKTFGIYTHKVDKEDIGTDYIFSDAEIVKVQWFKTEKKQLLHYNKK